MKISVVTVTLNNAEGLRSTLASLDMLRRKPDEVLVVDGCSTDRTAQVVDEYLPSLPIVFTSEPDGGIYDAMNKGSARATGDLLHYLNAGDTVAGEPYAKLAGPSLIPVMMYDEDCEYLFRDFVKWGGWGYCHQGIVFPSDHPPYRTDLRIAGDVDVIMKTFPGGLSRLAVVEGQVRFSAGGVSTRNRALRDREIRDVFVAHRGMLRAAPLLLAMAAGRVVPTGLRRALARHWSLFMFGNTRPPPEQESDSQSIALE